MLEHYNTQAAISKKDFIVLPLKDS